jgi:hypothetical protein
VVEGARLESVYTSKGYRGFESLTLRNQENKTQACKGFAFYFAFEGAKWGAFYHAIYEL